MKTLQGFTLDEVRAKLDTPLPPEAYKKIPGPGNFTDIDSNWQNRVFNTLFGLCGYGWGFDFDAKDVEVSFDTKENGRDAANAIIKRVELWFNLVDDEGKVETCVIASTGSNRNEFGNMNYALKGAITSALGAAASKMGWQESVYMGVRSHNDTNARVPAPPASRVETVPTPPAAPVEKPAVNEKPPLQFYGCVTCGKVSVVDAGTLVTCKCGSRDLIQGTSMLDVQERLKRFKETQQEAAAEKPVCKACGCLLPDAFTGITCPECGMDMNPPSEPLPPAPPTPEEMTAKFKELHGEMLRVANGSRPRILKAATEVCGRDIKGYSEMSIQELRSVIAKIERDSVEEYKGNPPPVAPGNAAGILPKQEATKSKVELVRELYSAASKCGLGTPALIMADLSKRWKKVITSSAQLSPEEIYTSIKEYSERTTS